MRQLRFALAIAGALSLCGASAVAQVFPSGSVQGNGTASSAPARATDINSVLYQKAGSDSCVFRRNSTSVACGSIDLSQSNAVGSSILGAANGGTGLAALGTGIATWLGTPSSANLRAVLTDETGTGLAYFQGGALGTPASGAATNLTGLPLSTGITGFGTGVATALAINIGSAGAPVLVNGVLGTPSSGTLTNATGLPIATGISGLGTGVATSLAVNVGTAGAPVVNGGVLGTPSSGTLTNATGLPISTGVSGLAANVATFLATPSSANLRAALTDETGTGIAYFVGGALGTPSSATLTSATGLPLSTGITGFGTGVATALAINVGSAGAPVVLNGALGTPSSGTLTNATGLPIASGVSGLGTGVATALAVNIGAAGAPVVLNGAGGTPSSLTLTNATGLPTAGLVNNAVTNAKSAQMAQSTIKGRAASAGTGDPTDLTATQATAILNACAGDAGSGAPKGLVPAQGAGDASGGKFLKADCTWAVPAGGGGGGGMTDTERQNALLVLAYQAKSFGALRRTVNNWAYGFKSTLEINAITSTSCSVPSSSCTIDTTLAKFGPSVVAGSYGSDLTTGTTPTASDDNAAAGNANDNNNATFFPTTDSATTTYTWEANIASPAIAGKYTFRTGSDGTRAGRVTQILFQGWNGSSWVTLDTYATGILAASTLYTRDQSNFTNVTSYSDYRLVFSLTFAERVFGAEIEIFEYTPGTTNNMAVITAPQTTNSSVSNWRALTEYELSDTPALNSDFFIDGTCALEAATVTISNASPGVISHSSHGLSVGDPVNFTTTGALPTGLTASTWYFVKTVANANSYTVSSTIGGAAINTSSAGSGTHTANFYHWTNGTLTAVDIGQSGRLVAETADTACTTSGTTPALRVRSANGKLFYPHVLTNTVH